MSERSESESAPLSPESETERPDENPDEKPDDGPGSPDPLQPDPLQRVLPRGMPAMGAGYARYAGVGIQFAVTILVFAYGGYRLDLWLNSSPWFLLVGVFVGFFGAMVSLVNKVKNVTAEQTALDLEAASHDGKTKTKLQDRASTQKDQV